MKVLLIEDEPPAMERMKMLLLALQPEIQIAGECDSVETALHYLRTQPTPDVIFTDVQLADGTCFDLFQHVNPPCPVVFITAFNHYAIEAFRVNAIDYLLKPLKKEELAKALTKLGATQATPPLQIDYTKLAQSIIAENQRQDKRYLIRYGEQVRTISSSDMAYIYTTSKAVFAVLHTGKEYPLDKTLDQLERELSSRNFFRINRQFIVNIKAIGHMHIVSKSRVQLELLPPFANDAVIVSTEKSPLFKEWLGGDD
ncbi:MAG: LytR/AlgR family response regulator transcription factor [Flavobacteriales bacterium]